MYGRTFDGVGDTTEKLVVAAAIDVITNQVKVNRTIKLGPGNDHGVLLTGLKDEVLAELEEDAEDYLNWATHPFIECKRGCGLGLAFIQFDLNPIVREQLRSLTGVKGFLKNRIEGLRNRTTLIAVHVTPEGKLQNTYGKNSLKKAWSVAKQSRHEDIQRFRHMRDEGEGLAIVAYCRVDTNDPKLPNLDRLHNSSMTGMALAQWVRANGMTRLPARCYPSVAQNAIQNKNRNKRQVREEPSVLSGTSALAVGTAYSIGASHERQEPGHLRR